ncbi:MAG TPA: hypothetical protein VK589_27545, partial [Chryseolinea sp.]|nr:hypothetical protein [Chryseolinea sp.]
ACPPQRCLSAKVGGMHARFSREFSGAKRGGMAMPKLGVMNSTFSDELCESSTSDICCLSPV